MSPAPGRKPPSGAASRRADGRNSNTALSTLSEKQCSLSPSTTSTQTLDANASVFVPGQSADPPTATSKSKQDTANKTKRDSCNVANSLPPLRQTAPLGKHSTGTHTAAALTAIRSHAEAEAQKQNIDTKDKAAMDAFSKEHGFRTAFADPANKRKAGTVITNFLNLTAPTQVYAYRLEFIRGRDPANPNNAIFVQKYTDRMALVQVLEQYVPLLRPVNGQRQWVTDGDLIWATTAFLGGNQQQQQPLVHVVHNPPQVDLSYRNECGSLLNVEEINVYFGYNVATNQAMPLLFRSQPGVPLRRNDSEILLRGLNAFLTKYARTRTQQTMFTSGKKAYQMNNSRQLEGNNANGELLRAFRGFYMSARPGIDRLLVNINSICSPFFGTQQTLEACLSSGFFANMTLGKKASLVEGLLVQLTFPFQGANASPQSRFRFVRGVGPPSSPCHTDQATTQPVSVLNCFLQNTVGCVHRRTPANKVPVVSPTSHAVRVAFNMRDNPPGGFETYPAEVLRIVDYQPFHGLLGPHAVRSMIDVAREDAAPSRARILDAGMNTFGLKVHGQSGLANLGGMQTGTEMLQIPATWLKPPTIRYFNRHNHNQVREFQPNLASWNLDGIRFAQTTAKVPQLRYINLSRQTDNALNRIKNELKGALFGHGILSNQNMAWTEITAPINPTSVAPPNVTLTVAFENEVARVLWQSRPQFQSTPIAVALPNNDPALYSILKRQAELRHGMHTVMFNASGTTFNSQKASNIALKWNLKLAQAPHVLPTSFACLKSQQGTSNTMVIGADVTHPGKGSADGCPSIAAIVGSTDDGFMHFPGSMRLQRSRKEYIIELGDMVKERLIDWAEKHNDTLPANVLFYRDGVADTQYDKLRSFEMPQIQQAFNWAREFLNLKRSGGGHNSVLDATRDPWPPVANPTPPGKSRDDDTVEDRFEDETQLSEPFNLTYVVVGKRHNTRFYATSDEDKIKPWANTPNTNVKPGLLVDQVITHPYRFDFYLQSHNPIAGTGRSAHYIVLQNNMNLTPTQLHETTHDFCYTYAKATRGVSYCAPAYYADRLCDRGRAYLYHYLSKSPHHPTPARNTATQTKLQHKDHIKDVIRQSRYYRPLAYPPLGQPRPRKYGFVRRNPWHPNMDGVMFYL